MKKNSGPVLIIMALLAIILLFVILIQGREALSAIDKSGEQIPIELSNLPKGQADASKAAEKQESSEVVSVEEEVLFPSFPVSLQYKEHPTTYTYFVVEKDSVNIFSGSSEKEEIIRRAHRNEKLDYVETVTVKDDRGSVKWYHVCWQEGEEVLFGFVKNADVSRRSFQFDKMEQAVLQAAEYEKRGKLTYVSNYKNQNGCAPLYQGKEKDRMGNIRSQSAPGYFSLTNKEDFLYIEDGTLIRYLFPAGELVKVEILASGETCYIPVKYIPVDKAITQLTTVVAVDRKNQNEAVYEKGASGWALISCTLATTGTTGKYSTPTPLGFYYAIAKSDQFLYYKDGTYTIQGYAPYAIRFAGGAYVHGVPVNYKYDDEGRRITPPKREFAESVGTVPLSHKCVRNYTSHAKFLFDKYEKGKMLVIVIE